MIRIILIFTLSVAFFLFLFLYRLRINKKGVLSKAKIVSIRESELRVVVRNIGNELVYYYPVIKYSYLFGGKTYFGDVSKANARKYRVPAYNSIGLENNNDTFFWRKLHAGDEIDIYIDPKKNQKSWLRYTGTKQYESETLALLFLASLFCVLSVLSYFYFP